MSVIQSTQPELRYTKRQNLENEARVIGNYYRDLIRSYGVDCIYHKLDTSEFSNFKKIIDRNTVLRHAYGYNDVPDYSMSVHTLTYMEVENDIFQLNKFGLNPNADVNFYFENNDFACALATKTGQFKEYPIKEIEIECEVPECTDEYEEYDDAIDENTKRPIRHYLSSDIFPYNLGLGYNEFYYCENLSGKLNVEINGYDVGKETTIACNPYEHTDFNVKFDSNSDLYKSMKHIIENDDYLETMIFLTFKVDRVVVGKEKAYLQDLLFNEMHSVYFMKTALRKLGKYLSYYKPIQIEVIDYDKITNIPQVHLVINYFEQKLDLEKTESYKNIKDLKDAIERLYKKARTFNIVKDKYKYILTGKIHGNVLFFDTVQLGKYANKIHPSVGDVITIDFPDEYNREMYEITDCFDKQLTQDGISPLLHKYIWKCKARRFVDSDNVIDTSEADKQLQEKKDYEKKVNEAVAKEISFYDDNQDAVYGGYELDEVETKNYDKQDVRNIAHVEYEGLPEGQLIDIALFECGSKLCTDGYSLIYMTKNEDFYVVTTTDHELTVRDAVFESGLKWLKATKDQVVFVNIEGQSTILAATEDVTDEINIEDIYNSTVDTNTTNKTGDSFIKFNSCKTYMFATADSLYVKLENDKQTYKLI